MAISYVPSAAEKSELDRLKTLWDSAASVEVIWKARIDLLNDFMTTPAMSNANYSARAQMFDTFKTTQTWFTWRDLFGGVIPIANGNINRDKYILFFADQYFEAIKATAAARQKYLDFKGVLDAKQVDVIAAQSDVIAAEKNNNTVRYIFAAIGTIVIVYVAYRVTIKFL